MQTPQECEQWDKGFQIGFHAIWSRRSKKVRLDSLGNGESLKAFEKENTRIKLVLQKTRPAGLGRKGKVGAGDTGKSWAGRLEIELDPGV